MKKKYGKKAKFCYMGKHRFTVHVKSKDVYADFAGEYEENI